MKTCVFVCCFFLSFLFLGQAVAYDLEENKNCPVPGITVRWQAAYCMAKNQTDDYENDGVTQCINEEEKVQPKFKNPCEANAYWKKKLCSTLNEDKKESMQCFKDQERIPRVVKFGVGG